jgi:hypothetical protein
VAWGVESKADNTVEDLLFPLPTPNQDVPELLKAAVKVIVAE